MSPAEKRKILDRIRKAMLDSPKSLSKLASESGLDKAALSRFQQGKTLSVESLEKLAPHVGLEIRATSAAVTKNRSKFDWAEIEECERILASDEGLTVNDHRFISRATQRAVRQMENRKDMTDTAKARAASARPAYGSRPSESG